MEKKEMQILNIPIEKYLELTGKPLSCYDFFDVTGASYNVTSNFVESINSVENVAKEKANGKGANVIVNAEYLVAGSGYRNDAYTAVLLKGIALKDKDEV